MNRASIIAPKSPLGSTRFTPCRAARRLLQSQILSRLRLFDRRYRCHRRLSDRQRLAGRQSRPSAPTSWWKSRGTPLSRADFFLPEGAPLILALGRLHEHKGFDVLLHSLVRVPDAYLFAGRRRPLETELEALAVKLGVRPRVRLLGWRDDVSDLLATVDLFVHPARHEPLGNVILEAWAQNCPVVSTAAEGPKVLIESGVSGLLTPVDDADALADAIRALVADPERRQVLAAGGRTTYDRKFKSIGRGFSLPQFLRADHRLMCGIAGIMTTSGAAPDPNLLAALSRAPRPSRPGRYGFLSIGRCRFHPCAAGDYRSGNRRPAVEDRRRSGSRPNGEFITSRVAASLEVLSLQNKVGLRAAAGLLPTTASTFPPACAACTPSRCMTKNADGWFCRAILSASNRFISPKRPQG